MPACPLARTHLLRFCDTAARRIVGKRKVDSVSVVPTAAALRAAALHLATGRALAAVDTVGMRKWVYRFASHEEMNRHTEEALARAIAANVRKQSARAKDQMDRIVLERALLESKRQP